MKLFDFFKKKKDTSISDTVQSKENKQQPERDMQTKESDVYTNNASLRKEFKENIKTKNKAEQDETNINKFSSNVVEVNVMDENKEREKLGGYYYRKYINKLEKMQPSNPILISAGGNKIVFDEGTVECFIDDLSTIYKKTIEPIEKNEENINTEFKFTNELLKLTNMIYSDNNFFNHLKSQEQEIGLINEIDTLDKMIDYLGDNLNILTKEFDEVEKKILGN